MSLSHSLFCVGICLAVSSFIAVHAAETSSTSYTKITAEGATTLEPLFQNLMFSFRDVDTSSRVVYTGTGSGSGRKAVLAGTADFAGSNTLFTATEMTGKTAKYWALLSSVSALVLTYNVPEVPASKQLVISRELAAALYMNDLRWWNDTRLAVLNPGITFPNKMINLVYRTDSSGTTNTLLQALTSFNNQSGLTVSDKPTWPFQSQTSRAFPASGNSQGSMFVLMNSYTIGYMSAAFTNGLPYFKMINKAGFTVSPTKQAVQSAVNYGVAKGSKNLPATASQTSPLGNMAYTIDAESQDAWPMAEFDFYLVSDIVNPDCFKSLQVVQFLIWSIQSKTAIAAMEFLNYIPVSGQVLDTVLTTLVNTKCGADGQQMVFDTMFPYEKAIVGIAIALAVISVLLGIMVVIKRAHPMVKRVGSIRLGLLSIVFAVNIFTVFLWVGYPTQVICQARPWVSAFSFIVVFGMIVIQVQDRVVNKQKYLQAKLLISSGTPTSGGSSIEGSGIESGIEMGVPSVPAIVAPASPSPSSVVVAASESHSGQTPMVAIALPAAGASSPTSASDNKGAFTPSQQSVEDGTAVQIPQVDGTTITMKRQITTAVSSNHSSGSTRVYDFFFRFFGLLLLVAVNLIIPIIWTSVAPPTEQYRRCTGAYAETFRQVMLFYNLFLIGSLALASVANSQRVQDSSYPVHVLLLVAALFVPLQFAQKGEDSDSLPDRSPLMIVLSPAVGVVFSTFLSLCIIVMPPVYRAFTMDNEEALAAIEVEAEVFRVRKNLNLE